MILFEPRPTQADLNFSVFGFHVRVSVWFWVVLTALGWQGITVQGATAGDRSKMLLTWILAGFLSILIHELGHALMFRRFRIPSRIVLHHAGGVAIGSGGARNPREQIAISLAGPFIQIAAALIVMMLVAISGKQVPFYGWLADLMFLPRDRPGIENDMLNWFVSDFLLVSIYWAIFNLFPIYPLDGGQISRQLFLMHDRTAPVRNSLILSMITCGLLAIFAIRSKDSFMAILFFYFAIMNYMEMQGGMHGGFGGGGYGGGFGGRQRW